MIFTVIDNKTGCYPDVEKLALTEDWAKHLIPCDIDTFALTEDGSLILLDDCGNCAYCPNDRFTVKLYIDDTKQMTDVPNINDGEKEGGEQKE